MTDRYSYDQSITNAEDILEASKKQLDLAMRQEHYNDIEYSDAQLQLEQALLSLEAIFHSSNGQQRESIDRITARIRNMQHQMITTPH